MKVAPETRSRWIELAASILVSAVTSAVVISWQLAKALTEYQLVQSVHESRLTAVERLISQASAENSAQTAQIAVQDSRYMEILRRLDAIDRKLEK